MTYGDDVELELQRKFRARTNDVSMVDGLFATAAETYESRVEERDELKRKWWEFHKQNPHVYEMFKRFTFDVIRRGRKQYSAQCIFERMRWHTEIETEGDEYKINNNHIPYYSRYFMHEHPEHKDFFKTRSTKSDR